MGKKSRFLIYFILIIGLLWLGLRPSVKEAPIERSSENLQYTADFFTARIGSWTKYLAPFKGRPGLQALEIGGYEGRDTIWLLRNILTDQSAHITVVDPFDLLTGDLALDKERKLVPVSPSADMAAVEMRFDSNIESAGFSSRVTKIKGFSQRELRLLPFNQFDIIYIDGSHLAKDVLLDAVLSWDLLKLGGLLIFDDYGWGGTRGAEFIEKGSRDETPAPAIDAFLDVFAPYLTVIQKEYQVIVRKDRAALPVR